MKDGKKYFGISMDIKQRWSDKGVHYTARFGKAIRSEGWDNFTHDILFEKLSRRAALRKEEQLIVGYKTYLPEYGYNSTHNYKRPNAYTVTNEVEVRIEDLRRKIKEKDAIIASLLAEIAAYLPQ